MGRRKKIINENDNVTNIKCFHSTFIFEYYNANIKVQWQIVFINVCTIIDVMSCYEVKKWIKSLEYWL